MKIKQYEVPRPIDVSEGMRDWQSKKDEQLALISREEKELSELIQQLRNDPRSASQISQEARVTEIIGGAAATETVGGIRVKFLQQSIADRKAAVRVLDIKIATERVSASKEICAKLAPVHSLLVEEVCKAMTALNSTMSNYGAFLDQLERQDVSYLPSLHPMRAKFLGRPNDPDSRIGAFLREAVQNRVVPPSIIPPELRR